VGVGRARVEDRVHHLRAERVERDDERVPVLSRRSSRGSGETQDHGERGDEPEAAEAHGSSLLCESAVRERAAGQVRAYSRRAVGLVSERATAHVARSRRG
jgi:hypothetical protein